MQKPRVDSGFSRRYGVSIKQDLFSENALPQEQASFKGSLVVSEDDCTNHNSQFWDDIFT